MRDREGRKEGKGGRGQNRRPHSASNDNPAMLSRPTPPLPLNTLAISALLLAEYELLLW